MRRNNRSRRGKIPQKEYTKHAIIRRTAQCLQGVEGILPKMVLENYCKTIVIEANTMVDMVKREIIPAVEAYAMELARTASAKKRVDETLACRYESGLIKKLSTLTDQMAVRTDALETALIELQDVKDIVAQSYQIRDTVLTRMQELRIACDEAETVTAKKYWPFPTYGDLLFSVK